MSIKVEIGQRFERLTVMGYALRRGYVVCSCDCGASKEIAARHLTQGATRSCGCLHREQLAERRRTHGASESLTWKRWRSMLTRCTMPNTKSYPRYGGRGIQICDSWKSSFEAFLADMGECPGTPWTVERNNNNGHYEPSNCRWATRKEQNRNSSHNRLIEFEGRSLCLTEWSEATGIHVRTIMARLNKGWSIEEALTIPVRPHRPRAKSAQSFPAIDAGL